MLFPGIVGLSVVEKQLAPPQVLNDDKACFDRSKTSLEGGEGILERHAERDIK